MHAQNQLFSEKVLDWTIDTDTFREIFRAKVEMLDQVGTVQHHDAITGTAK